MQFVRSAESRRDLDEPVAIHFDCTGLGRKLVAIDNVDVV